jgi:hypothetical protein
LLSSSSMSFNLIDYSLSSTLLPDNTKWCPRYNTPRPVNMAQQSRWFERWCYVPLSKRLDLHFNSFWKDQQRKLPQPRHNNNNNNNTPNPANNFGPLYASLPVQRVTMLREPFGSLISKYSWHRIQKEVRCDNLKNTAWAHDFSVNYMLYLCGVDCVNRFDHGTITLDEIEAQAAYNLRNSFSIVGILNDDKMEDFYDMISKWVAYIDTTTISSFWMALIIITPI